MEGFKDLYLRKCTEYSCEPISAVLSDIAQDNGSTLTSLQLNGNSKRLFNQRIELMQAFALVETLFEDSNIVSLDLSFNNLNDLAAQPLARLIKMNHHIRVLNLAGNDLTAVGAQHLAESLSDPSSTLQGLLLSGNPLEDKGVVALGHMLRSNKSLLTLHLGNTRAGISGVIRVCTALGEDNVTMESLDLSRPMIPGGPQDTTTLSVAQMLARNKTLRRLNLSKHSLVDSQLDTLVTYGLLRNTSLKVLDLSANKLSGFAGPTLERLLNDNHQLQELNLSSNILADAGALSVARSLPYSSWLKCVDLRSNGIGEQGLVALAEALSLASHIHSLFLWGNNFGPGACRAFYDTLAAIGTEGLSIDIKPYEVDGRVQVALVDGAKVVTGNYP